MDDAIGVISRLWTAGRMPLRDGLYRPDDTAVEIHVDGPGAYHPDAGQPIPFALGEPIDVVPALAADGETGADAYFDDPLPNGSGWLTGGGGGMGNIGYFARLDAERRLYWLAVMFLSNPFVSVRFDGTAAVLTNDWRNLLRLNLTAPGLA